MDTHERSMMEKLAESDTPVPRGTIMAWFGHRSGPQGPRSVRGNRVANILAAKGWITSTPAELDTGRYQQVMALTAEGWRELVAARASDAA